MEVGGQWIDYGLWMIDYLFGDSGALWPLHASRVVVHAWDLYEQSQSGQA